MHQIIEVHTAARKQYPVYIGQDLHKPFIEFCTRSYTPQKAFVVMDSRVARLHGNKILRGCREFFETCIPLEIPEGETSKSVDRWQRLVDNLLAEGVERTTPVIAVGGGVTGDVTGFAAASALRGLPLIHMPTTLLAMADSSIGGKTGINHAEGKNLIGAFYQPDAVFSDLKFLETLEKREWINGLAEVIKYAAIHDESLFKDIEQCIAGGFTVSDGWADLIARSVRIKTDIVREDVLEGGKRAWLNFGHTFAHALEKQAGYGVLSHGEAVFAGMLAACHVSRKMGAGVDGTRFEPFLPLYQKKPVFNAAPDLLIELMYRDKKVQNRQVRLVLLNAWGKPYLATCDDHGLLKEAWEHALNQIFNFNTHAN